MRWTLIGVALIGVLMVAVPLSISVSSDDGNTYTCKIELESNPTTGYDWYVVSADGLKVDSEFINTAPEGICGAPGVKVFTLTSDQPGTYHFKAEYKRIFQEGSTVDTFEQDVVLG